VRGAVKLRIGGYVPGGANVVDNLLAYDNVCETLVAVWPVQPMKAVVTFGPPGVQDSQWVGVSCKCVSVFKEC